MSEVKHKAVLYVHWCTMDYSQVQSRMYTSIKHVNTFNTRSLPDQLPYVKGRFWEVCHIYDTFTNHLAFEAQTTASSVKSAISLHSFCT